MGSFPHFVSLGLPAGNPQDNRSYPILISQSGTPKAAPRARVVMSSQVSMISPHLAEIQLLGIYRYLFQHRLHPTSNISHPPSLTNPINNLPWLPNRNIMTTLQYSPLQSLPGSPIALFASSYNSSATTTGSFDSVITNVFFSRYLSNFHHSI